MTWSEVRETVAEVLSPPNGLILSCGIIDYEDPTVSYARTGGAPLARLSHLPANSCLLSKDKDPVENSAYDTSFIMRDIGERHDHA